MSTLQDPLIWATYSYSIASRFNTISEENVGDWQYLKDAITGATKEVQGDWHKAARQPWISNDMFQIINWCHEAWLQDNIEEYILLNHTQNESIIDDHKKYWGKETRKFEDVAQHSDFRGVFQMLWQAKAGPRNKNYLIKDSNGSILMTKAYHLDCWAEHFQQLLNHPPPQHNGFA